MNLEKGAKVKVRLRNGNITEGIYDSACIYVEKHHWILIDGFSKIMGDFRGSFAECRLVGPACVNLPVGVSV